MISKDLSFTIIQSWASALLFVIRTQHECNHVDQSIRLEKLRTRIRSLGLTHYQWSRYVKSYKCINYCNMIVVIRGPVYLFTYKVLKLTRNIWGREWEEETHFKYFDRERNYNSFHWQFWFFWQVRLSSDFEMKVSRGIIDKAYQVGKLDIWLIYLCSISEFVLLKIDRGCCKFQ